MPQQDRLLLELGHAYEAARGPITREPPVRPGTDGVPLTNVGDSSRGGPSISQVLDAARLMELRYLTETDAAGIAASIGPIKATLARAGAEGPGEPNLYNY